MAPNILNNAAKGSVLGFAGSMIGKIFALVLQVYISRLFGPKFFGLFITCIITCQFFRIFGSLGMAKGGLHFIAVAIERKKFDSLPGIFLTVFIGSILSGILVGFALYLSAPFIATTWFNDPQMPSVLNLFSFSIPFLILLRTVSELSRGFKIVKYSVIIEDAIFPLSQILFFLFFYYLNFGFDSVAYSYIIACILSAVLIIGIVSYQIKKVLPRGISARQIICLSFPLPWKEIFKFSIPFIPIALSLISYNYVDVIMLNIFSDSSNVGLYAAASRLSLIFSMLFLASSKIFTPLIAASYGANKNENIKLLYQAITRWMLCLNIPVFLLVALYNKQIMMLFGSNFLEKCPETLVILSAGHIIASITGGVGIILTMTGNQHKELLNVVIGFLLNLILNFFFIPAYGIVGAAMGTTLSRLSINSIRILMVFKIYKIQPFSFRNGRVLGFGICVYFLHQFAIHTVMPHINYAPYFSGILVLVLLIAFIIKFGFEKEDQIILNSMFKYKRRMHRKIDRP